MKAPAFLRQFHTQLPPIVPALPFVAGLEVARRLRWLAPPPELDGRCFALHLNDLDLHMGFACAHGRFYPRFKAQGELELTADTADFLALLRGMVDADTLFFQRRLQIRGDTELGLIVKNWLDAAERPAWLQNLARRTGYEQG